jgi:hypothetical protein
MRISAFFLSLFISFELILSPIIGGIFIQTARAQEPCGTGYYRDSSGRCVVNSELSTNALGARNCADITNTEQKRICYENLSANKIEEGANAHDVDQSWRRMNKDGTGSIGASFLTAVAIMVPMIMLIKQMNRRWQLDKKNRNQFTCSPLGLMSLYGGAAVLGVGEIYSFFNHRKKMKDLDEQWKTLSSTNSSQNQDEKNNTAFVAATKAWEFQANTEYQMEKTTKLKAGYYTASAALFATGAILSAIENGKLKAANGTLKTLLTDLGNQKIALEKLKLALPIALAKAAVPATAAAGLAEVEAIRKQAMLLMEAIKKNTDLYAATMKQINKLTCHAGYVEKTKVKPQVADPNDPKIPKEITQSTSSQQLGAVINSDIEGINKTADELGDSAEKGLEGVNAKLEALQQQKIEAENQNRQEVAKVTALNNQYLTLLPLVSALGLFLTQKPNAEIYKNGVTIKMESDGFTIKPVAPETVENKGAKPQEGVIETDKKKENPIINVWNNIHENDVKELLDLKYKQNAFSVISQTDNLIDLMKGFKEIETMESSSELLNSDQDFLTLSLLDGIKIDPKITAFLSNVLISSAHAQAATPAIAQISKDIISQQKLGDALTGFQKEIKFINGQVVGQDRLENIDKKMNGWFSRQFVLPKKRMIINSLLGVWTGVMSQAMFSQAALAKRRGDELMRLQEQFKSNEGLLGCNAQLRNDASRPDCYCYTADNKINTARSNHAVCKGVASNIPTGGNYLNKTPNAPNVCVDQNFGLDPKCSCKNRKNSSGQNSCLNVSVSASSGILNPGSFKMLGSAVSPANDILSGNSTGADIDGSIKTQAAAIRKMADQILDKTEPGLSQKINKDTDKIASALQGAFSGMQMGGPMSLASSQSPISSDPKKAVEELEKSLREAAAIPSFSSSSPMALDEDEAETNLDVTEETQLAEVMGKELDYGNNDISNNSSSNIFDVLSNRYQRSGMRRLFDENGTAPSDAPAETDLTP